MKATHKMVLQMGKLKIPLATYKSVDNTTPTRATEVTKINGQIYKVQRKPYVILADGTEQDIDKTQVLKSYEKDNGEIALFTKEEQSQLLKKGSSKEWNALAVVDNHFGELAFQKDGMIAMVELEKKKDLLNKQRLKFFAMLKAGLGEKAIITQVLYKNCEYPVVITNYGEKLLVRFLHYQEEIRQIESEELPKLTTEETDKAKAFITQFYKPDFKYQFENRTEEQTMKIINSRGTNVESVEAEQTIIGENPFEIEVE